MTTTMTTIEQSARGSERWEEQPVMRFDLAAILSDLKREPSWKASRRNAVTLLKQPGFRVVLIAVQAGSTIAEHKTNCALGIELLEGEVEVRLGDDVFTLGAGQLLTLRPGIEHAIRSPGESAFLLTVAGDAAHPAEVDA